MTEQQKNEELPTALGVKLLACSNCGDIVVPRHYEKEKEIVGTDCNRCTSGILKIEESSMVRRQDVKQLIENKTEQMKEKLKEQSDKSTAEKAWNSGYNQAIREIQELLEEVQNQ